MGTILRGNRLFCYKKVGKKFGQFFAENLFLNKIDVGIKSMESIEKHIEADKEILANPNTSPNNVAT